MTYVFKKNKIKEENKAITPSKKQHWWIGERKAELRITF
jgi:hypothetical protein